MLLEERKVMLGCSVHRGVVSISQGLPSLAPETSGMAMMVYLLQFFKLGVPPGTGGQVFLLSSWNRGGYDVHEDPGQISPCRSPSDPRPWGDP